MFSSSKYEYRRLVRQVSETFGRKLKFDIERQYYRQFLFKVCFITKVIYGTLLHIMCINFIRHWYVSDSR